MHEEPIFTLQDVISLDFEARCVGPDGARYIWHHDVGLRVDSIGTTTLLTDPSALPEANWSPTRSGLEELRGAAPPDCTTSR